MQQQLIEQLRDIHLPQPPTDDTWQLAMLVALLSIAIVSVVYGLFQRLRSSPPVWQRDAINSLRQAKALEPHAALTDAAITLRGVANHLRQDDWARNATGRTYLRHLDEVFDGKFFVDGPGHVFGDLLYRQTPSRSLADDAIDGLITLLKRYSR